MSPMTLTAGRDATVSGRIQTMELHDRFTVQATMAGGVESESVRVIGLDDSWTVGGQWTSVVRLRTIR